ncbi:GSCOCG00004670001-RA-CDS [Cotesia congregata]|uniref:Uncharacterized protein n=1 Tax=Cotesia congregata TaxID=51543 RepID=A0A8J2HE35_COTCN|nr:GSCOCG00004670001-RA-CDS [Cotesia congregata]CAG5092210.1 Protein of unknown function [Cotesia congregata]
MDPVFVRLVSHSCLQGTRKTLENWFLRQGFCKNTNLTKLSSNFRLELILLVKTNRSKRPVPSLNKLAVKLKVQQLSTMGLLSSKFPQRLFRTIQGGCLQRCQVPIDSSSCDEENRRKNFMMVCIIHTGANKYYVKASVQKLIAS